MHFCIFNLSCYALLKANVYIFQSCTWLLTLFPTFRYLKLKIRNFKGFFWSFFCIVQFSRFLLLSFSTAFIFYHIFPFLSSPFFKFFQILFSGLSFDSMWRLFIVSRFFPFVKPFFKIFLIFSFKLFSRLTWQLIYITTFICFWQQVSTRFV